MTIDGQKVDAAIARLDRQIAEQIGAIIAEPSFVELERAWRSLWHVVEVMPEDSSVRLLMVQCSKEDLRRTLAVSPDSLAQAWRGVSEPRAPLCLVLGDYAFSAAAEEMQLLETCAFVARRLHVPFVTALGPQFFGVAALAQLTSDDAIAPLEDRSHAAYRRLREHDDASYLGVLLPPGAPAWFGALAAKAYAERGCYLELGEAAPWHGADLPPGELREFLADAGLQPLGSTNPPQPSEIGVLLTCCRVAQVVELALLERDSADGRPLDVVANQAVLPMVLRSDMVSDEAKRGVLLKRAMVQVRAEEGQLSYVLRLQLLGVVDDNGRDRTVVMHGSVPISSQGGRSGSPHG